MSYQAEADHRIIITYHGNESENCLFVRPQLLLLYLPLYSVFSISALRSICDTNLWMSTESRLLRELCKLVSNDYISKTYIRLVVGI